MKFKNVFKVFVLLGMLLLFSACSMENDMIDANDPNNDSPSILETNVPNRKIIYKVSAKLYVNDIEVAIESLRNKVENSGWFDEETISENYAYFKVRIKTSELDDFVKKLNDDGIVENYTKKGTDVSLNYQSKVDKVASLQAELTRLIELKAQASIYELIQINTRISEVEAELLQLNGSLMVYDSLIEYSEVTLTYNRLTKAHRLPLGKRTIDSFLGGLSALGTFFEVLIIVIAAVLPFAIVFVPAFFGIRFLIRRKRNKLHRT